MRVYAHQVDANQGEIVDALRKAGAFVADLSGAGEGVPDLFVVWRQWAGFLEVKTPDGRLRPKQRTFIAECPLPVRVVRSWEEALEVIGAV